MDNRSQPLGKRRKTVRKTFFAILCMTAAVLAWQIPSLAAADYKPEYKLSTVLARPMPWGIAGDRWAELVESESSGLLQRLVIERSQSGGKHVV